MKTSDFSFEVPEELIAQAPTDRREEARLMRLSRHTGSISHHRIENLPELLAPETVLVVNDTRVRKARLEGRFRDTGGRIELLLLSNLGESRWEALFSRARKLRPGREIELPGGRIATIIEGQGPSRVCAITPAVDDDYLAMFGSIPLPPYIRRAPTGADETRYQTVYARAVGSAAAPTAGLHLTAGLLARISEAGIRVVSVTLHVGLGTFAPIRTEHVENHVMHSEEYFIPEETARAVQAAPPGRVTAVGTTVVRALESAARDGQVRPGAGATDLFIRPGYRFRLVSGLLTNFHTPQSSLIVMVSAFAGREPILRAYETAVRERYRFFSYGDAMLIQ
jgi:S-adenosylmethionine:tRNA ribosyltransferase-isomerase